MTHLSSKRRSMLLIAIPALALIVWGGWFLTHRDSGVETREATPLPVPATTVLVKRRDMPNYLTGIGTVTARRTVTVRTRIDGQLEKIGFKEGQDVKAGQLLAQLDPRTQRAQLDGAKAKKAKDQAQLANAEITRKQNEKTE